ncbi:glycosyltransferase family 2 protein [Desulfonatronum thiodismutans]|uniref:glycosyltransferase family 2 protein n=1 Tax=Desulfonatronum thiodismutans TaxID=159290 RepID=UPI00068E3135|nr:glycosyltransferase family 2 protein [Desulfonatronum thiodismutans]
MTSPHLSIIIPVFNQWPLTEQCLRSLREHTPGRFFEVIVVDNASTDETATHCKALGNNLFPERFHYLPQPDNLGFGQACNIGANQAAGEFLFFLNNDTILTPNWSPPLLQAFRSDPLLGAVGPLLLYPGSDRVQHLGVAFLPGFQAEHIYEHFPSAHPLVRKPRRLQAISGAAFFIPRELFRECDGFFKDYRNGCEDLDLCIQVRKKKRRISCIPESVVYHLTSQTQGRFDKDADNSALLLYRCGASIKPDILELAAMDGYEPRLTPWLAFYVALPNDRLARLNAEAGARPSPQATWDGLLQEPLWTPGYALLAEALERAAAWDEACMIRFLQVHFEPSVEGMARLLHTAQQAKNGILVEQALEKRRNILAKLQEPAPLTARARSIIAQAHEDRNEAVEALYTKWLSTQEPAFPKPAPSRSTGPFTTR